MDDDDLIRMEHAEKKYQEKLSRAPGCNDPDHPGCARCEGDYDEELLLCSSP